MFDLIAFDADDTLWHNESLYLVTKEKFAQLLTDYVSLKDIESKLYEVETANLRIFGYGIKGFALSMIETAVELTDGQIQGTDIHRIISFAKEMLQADIRPFDHVESVLSELSQRHRLMLITKGDLFDQETKIAGSGLADYFSGIEIVSSKVSTTYSAILDENDTSPDRFLMIGNSLRSDILPVLDIGGQAVYIPYHLTWAHETVPDHEADKHDYFELEHIRQLPDLIERLSNREGAKLSTPNNQSLGYL